ncbi:HAD family hydrolase [Candidatus Parabeggiatoa sp. HSG14]|uniref:HAD family hydrolase n=1 Tax=Candidatus Parabeggiatoa sp. HSG14 TaxID=3055593 RepID=UPI0025A90805|nr:HAD family hydrolase [Thiotrichales bacterium HSG14]
MTKLSALIFDVDGTLAETERDAHRVAFNEAFAEYHLDWHWTVELYGELLTVTGGKERIKHYVNRYRPDYNRPDNFDAFVADLHQKKTALYQTLLARNPISLRPGVRRLLEEARREGIRLAIATTTTLKNANRLLEHSLMPEAVKWFEVIAAGDMVSAKKPAADIYEYVLKDLGLKPEECLAIEDSKNGLRSAMGANLRTLVTVSDYTRHEDFSEAFLVLNHLGEPDKPFTVLAGNVGDARYVDIALLRHLFS